MVLYIFFVNRDDERVRTLKYILKRERDRQTGRQRETKRDRERQRKRETETEEEEQEEEQETIIYHGFLRLVMVL